MDNIAQLRALTGGVYPIIYVVFVAFASFYFTRKTEKPLLMFPIIFWLLGEPVIFAYYTIDLTWLPFDLQPNRILFLYLLGLLPFVHYENKSIDNSLLMDERKVPFEKYLVVFICALIFALVLNRNALETKRIFAIPLEPLTFLLLYLTLKRIITEKILVVIFQVIILMGILNALIAFVQLADPLFLRTGMPRIAFGNVYRSFGTFNSEYVLGGFQTIAMFVAVTYMKKGWFKVSVLSLMFCSILITFHRMGLIILLISIVFYTYKFSKKGLGIPQALIMLVFVVSVTPIYMIFTSFGGQSQLVKDRLLDNTVSGRFDQYIVVIKEMAHYPLGLGSEDNPIYQKIMIDHGYTKSVIGSDGQQQNVGLAVHNGFLSIGITYGILAMLIFIMMLVSMWKYFYSRASKEFAITVIPLISIMVWALANLSNGIIVFRAYNVLIIAILAGSFVGVYKKGILKSPKIKQNILKTHYHTNKSSTIIGNVNKTNSRLINKINDE